MTKMVHTGRRSARMLASGVVGLAVFAALPVAAHDTQDGSGPGDGQTPTTFTLEVPTRPFAFLPEALPEAAGTVRVRPLGNLDEVQIQTQGLPANAEYVVFLTELPTAPFGAVQYIADFETDATGRGDVTATTITFDAFALTGIAQDGRLDGAATNATRKQLDHVVIWPTEPETTAAIFSERGQPVVATPFDDDGRAGPAILTNSNDATAAGPLADPQAPAASAAATAQPSAAATAHPSQAAAALPATGTAGATTGLLAGYATLFGLGGALLTWRVRHRTHR